MQHKQDNYFLKGTDNGENLYQQDRVRQEFLEQNTYNV